MGVKGNKELNEAAKETMDLPGMTTIRLPYTGYYLPRNSEWQREWENSTRKLN